MNKNTLSLLILAAALILTSCGAGTDGDGGTGGITAQVIWPSATLSSKAGATLEKAPPEVRWVRMLVSNGTTTITSSDFDTTLVSTGTLGGIPAGSGWTLTVQGLDNGTPRMVVYQGAKAGITVTAGQTTNAGPVSMQVYIASGTLDSSFGTAGIVNKPTGTFNLRGIPGGIVFQPDGRTIAAGTTLYNPAGTSHVTLMRLNVDGTFDSSFDNGTTPIPGIVTNTTFTGGVSSVVSQPDGKILLLGYAIENGEDFALLRYDANGGLDSSFGVGGMVKTTFGSGADRGKALALDLNTSSTGTIIAAGYATINSFPYFALAFYTYPSGTLISQTTTSSGFGYGGINAIAVQADHKILAGGFNSSFPVLARFLPNGTLDMSLNAVGYVNLSGLTHINSILVQPDGKILVGGAAPSMLYFSFARLNANGTLDTTFGSNGYVSTAFVGTSDILQSLVLQPDGSIFAIGGTGSGGPGMPRYIAIAKYLPDGNLDISFGTGGQKTISLSNNDDAFYAGLPPDGKLVIFGYKSTAAIEGDWIVARLWNSTTTKAKAYGVSGNIMGVINTITSSASTTYASVYNVGIPPSNLPTSLQGVTVNHLTNRLYASDLGGFTGTKVFVVDTISNRTLSAITVGTGPNGVLANPDTNRLYVGIYGSGAGNTVTVVDTTDNTIAASIFGFSGPKGLALNSAGNRLYVGNTGAGTVSVVDTISNSIIATIPGVSDPTNIRFDKATNKLFVANNNNGSGTMLSVVNTLTNAITSNITVSAAPLKLALDSDASRLYVSHYGNGSGNLVSVVSTTSNSVLHTITTGTGPNSIAIDTTNKKLYVDAYTESKIYIYDVANDSKNLVSTMSGGVSNIAIVP